MKKKRERDEKGGEWEKKDERKMKNLWVLGIYTLTQSGACWCMALRCTSAPRTIQIWSMVHDSLLLWLDQGCLINQTAQISSLFFCTKNARPWALWDWAWSSFAIHTPPVLLFTPPALLFLFLFILVYYIRMSFNLFILYIIYILYAIFKNIKTPKYALLFILFIIASM